MDSTEIEPGPEAWERARLIYAAGTVPAGEIAASLRLSRAGFYREVRRRGWPRRNPHFTATRTGRKLRRRIPWDRVPSASAAPSPTTPVVPAAPDVSAAPGGTRAGPRREAEALLARLLRLLARRMDALEAITAGPDPDPERTDRHLAQTARVAAQIRAEVVKLGQHAETPSDDAHPPRSINELRDELLRHLERVRLEARARRLRREPERS